MALSEWTRLGEILKRTNPDAYEDILEKLRRCAATSQELALGTTVGPDPAAEPAKGTNPRLVLAPPKSRVSQ